MKPTVIALTKVCLVGAQLALIGSLWHRRSAGEAARRSDEAVVNKLLESRWQKFPEASALEAAVGRNCTATSRTFASFSGVPEHVVNNWIVTRRYHFDGLEAGISDDGTLLTVEVAKAEGKASAAEPQWILPSLMGISVLLLLIHLSEALRTRVRPDK